MFIAILLFLFGGGGLFFSIWITPYSNADTTIYIVASYAISIVLLLCGLWKLADEMCWFYPAPKTTASTSKKNTPKPTTAKGNTPKPIKTANTALTPNRS